jgi:TolB-like protein/DNA-binding winged helix-turn-helix (wHTH) protein/Tfp pilus assembly protein PilF
MVVGGSPAQFRFAGYTLDLSARKLFGPDGAVVTVSSRAFDVLVLLVTHQGETLSKSTIMETVWPNSVVEENNLNQAISSLRKVLNDNKSDSRLIQTIPGRGYCFVTAPALADTVLTTVSTSAATASPRRWFSKRLAVLAAGVVLVVGGLLYGVWLKSVSSGEPLSLQQQRAANGEVIANSIAIVPFTNLNPEQEDKTFALGLHDELINQLTKVKSLKVMSGSSVLTLTEQGRSVPEIAQLLRVESMLTGSIRQAGDKTRVNLSLLDPRTGVALWASSYDADSHNLPDMIAIQSDIASNVAHTLEAEIKLDEQAAIAQQPTNSFEAYRFLLSAKNAHKNQDFTQAWKLDKKALEHDPNYVDALIHFAHVNGVMTGAPLAELSKSQHAQLALEAIDKAIALTPDNVEVQLEKALLYAMDRQWNKAMAIAEQLKNSGVPLAQMNLFGSVLISLGDFKGAVEMFEANLNLEPVNFSTRGFLLMAYELDGQRERARQEFTLGEELNPEWWGRTINVFLSIGRKEPVELDDASSVPTEQKPLHQRLDDQASVSAAIHEFQQKPNKVGAELAYYSAIAAAIGENELALEFMRESLQDAWQGFFWMWLPVFDEVRMQPGFRDLLIESGIVEYWQQHGWPEVCQPDGASFSCDWRAYP